MNAALKLTLYVGSLGVIFVAAYAIAAVVSG